MCSDAGSTFVESPYLTSWTTGARREPQTSDSLPISVRAIETLLGWVGQVLVGRDISWEGESWEDPEQALDEARMRVVHVLRNANVE